MYRVIIDKLITIDIYYILHVVQIIIKFIEINCRKLFATIINTKLE